jgi:ABC-type ATPase involved in cell division/cell division protein FtsX
VRLAGVKKAFGKRTVIESVDLNVAPGEVVEITGPSGAGKTTMLRLIHGQIRPTAGEVWVEGQALHRRWRRELDRVRRDVAYVFQDQRLLPRLTAIENVVLALTVNDPTVPRSAIKRRALASLEALGVAHRKDAFPSQLSAGEIQRVAVARALATAPRVILADEPFTSIDRANAQVVARMLEEAAAHGAAVVVATHHPTGRAHRVLQLPEGASAEPARRVAAATGVRAARAGWRRLLESSAPVPAATDEPAAGGAPEGSTNGHANGHANGRTNAEANRRANGHANVEAAQGAAAQGAAAQGAAAQIRGRAKARLKVPRVLRRAGALFANSFRLVVLDGLKSWRRDLRFNAPALETMALLLLMCGLLGLVFSALVPAVVQAQAQASVVRVFLADGATDEQVSALQQSLRANPHVASVRYISAQEALQEASQQPGLSTFAGMSDSNPFPASLEVKAKLATEVAGIVGTVEHDPAVDQSNPTSYDPTLYGKLRNLAIGVGVVGGTLVLLLALIAYAVAANAMRATAAARREEVKTLRLLGARKWMLRDPFIIEGLMTGALAGAAAAALVAGAWYLAWEFTRATYVVLLPGVGLTAMRYVVASVIVAGMAIGVLTSLLSFRRVRA